MWVYLGSRRAWHLKFKLYTFDLYDKVKSKNRAKRTEEEQSYLDTHRTAHRAFLKASRAAKEEKEEQDRRNGIMKLKQKTVAISILNRREKAQGVGNLVEQLANNPNELEESEPESQTSNATPVTTQVRNGMDRLEWFMDLVQHVAPSELTGNSNVVSLTQLH